MDLELSVAAPGSFQPKWSQQIPFKMLPVSLCMSKALSKQEV
jgi:hypothetical protein